MTLRDLLAQNRSYRRFDESCRLERSMLVEWVGMVRLCASGGNRQPLRFLVASTPQETAKIFPHLRWAASLPAWNGPVEGQRPAAYILILGDTRIVRSFDFDAGIAAEAILLAATEQGFGGCMVGSIDRQKLRAALHIPEEYKIVLAVALGKPVETVVLEDAQSPDEIVYWRDSAEVHHVPKRPLSELLVEFAP
jgi:nitroreductase